MILLFALLCYFWPGEKTSGGTKEKLPLVDISLGPELSTWFRDASLRAWSRGQLDVTLHRVETKARVTQAVTMHLGYDLKSEGRTLYRGTVACSLAADEDRAKLALSNPEHVAVNAIHFYLAH